MCVLRSSYRLLARLDDSLIVDLQQHKSLGNDMNKMQGILYILEAANMDRHCNCLNRLQY